jgi:hypothetical protein
VVVITAARSQTLQWKVVAESQPDYDEEEDDESGIGLKNLEEITRVQYNILIAHLFLKLTFKVCLSCLFLFFLYILTTILFIVVFSSKNLKSKLARLNEVVQKTNNKERGSKI